MASEPGVSGTCQSSGPGPLLGQPRAWICTGRCLGMLCLRNAAEKPRLAPGAGLLLLLRLTVSGCTQTQSRFLTGQQGWGQGPKPTAWETSVCPEDRGMETGRAVGHSERGLTPSLLCDTRQSPRSLGVSVLTELLWDALLHMRTQQGPAVCDLEGPSQSPPMLPASSPGCRLHAVGTKGSLLKSPGLSRDSPHRLSSTRTWTGTPQRQWRV